MIENIRNSFINRLNQATWMDKDSKEKAVDKVQKSISEINIKEFLFQANAIDKQIGYPDYLGSDNNTKLENDYAEVRSSDCIFIFIFC